MYIQSNDALSNGPKFEHVKQDLNSSSTLPQEILEMIWDEALGRKEGRVVVLYTETVRIPTCKIGFADGASAIIPLAVIDRFPSPVQIIEQLPNELISFVRTNTTVDLTMNVRLVNKVARERAKYLVLRFTGPRPTHLCRVFNGSGSPGFPFSNEHDTLFLRTLKPLKLMLFKHSYNVDREFRILFELIHQKNNDPERPTRDLIGGVPRVSLEESLRNSIVGVQRMAIMENLGNWTMENMALLTLFANLQILYIQVENVQAPSQSQSTLLHQHFLRQLRKNYRRIEKQHAIEELTIPNIEFCSRQQLEDMASREESTDSVQPIPNPHIYL